MKKLNYQNLTTAVLAGSATYTGTGIDLGNYKDPIGSTDLTKIYAFACASHASAANGFKIDVSNDNTTWFLAAQGTAAAGVGLTLEIPIVARYFRVRYTNDATLQTSFTINITIA